MDGPLPPPTFKTVDLGDLWDLQDALADAAEGRELDHALLAEVAEQEDVPVAHIYAAAGGNPGLSWDTTQPVVLRVCVGGCQGWGGLALVDALLAERARREEAGAPGFDVTGAGCVQACYHRPAVASNGPMGAHVHPSVTVEQVPELVAALCD